MKRDLGTTGSFRGALVNRDVRRVLGSLASNAVTENLFTTALAIYLVVTVGPGAVALLSLRYVAIGIVGPVAALPTEAVGPRLALTGVGAMRAAMLGAAALALAAGAPLGAVVAFAVVDAVLAAVGHPAAAAAQVIVARSPGELAAASAMGANVKSVGQVFGALLGGFLSAVLPTPAVFGVGAAIALAGGAGAFGLRMAQARRETSLADRLRRSPGGRWTALRDSRVAHVVGIRAVHWSVKSAWVGLAVLAATGFLGMGEAGVGALAGAAGAGTIASIPAGVAMIGRPRLGRLAGLSLVVAGVPLVLLATLGTPTAALVFIAAWGTGVAVGELAVAALLPRVARGEGVSRVVSISEAVKAWMQAAGVALVPLSVELVGTRGAVAAWGAVPIAGAVLARRGLDRVDTDVAAHLHVLERVRAVELFSSLRVVELERVAGALRRRRFADGETLVREGDAEARSFFVLDRGTAEVTVRGTHVRHLAEGDGFGDIALLHRVARTATVTATSDVELFELEREAFIRAVSEDQAGEDVLPGPDEPDHHRSIGLGDALRTVPFLAGVGDEARAALASAAVVRDLPAGAVLCTEGEAADSVFVLLAGAADVMFEDAVLGRLRPGESFGEIGLVHDVARTATVRARGPVRVAELTRDAITTALGHAPAPRDIATHVI